MVSVHHYRTVSEIVMLMHQIQPTHQSLYSCVLNITPLCANLMPDVVLSMLFPKHFPQMFNFTIHFILYLYHKRL